MNGEQLSEIIQGMLPSKAALKDWLAVGLPSNIDTEGLAEDLWSWFFNTAAKKYGENLHNNAINPMPQASGSDSGADPQPSGKTMN